MKRLTLLYFVFVLALVAAERRAKNVILFIGDAAGVPTLNAASAYGYGEPQRLFIQHMPHHGLMDTSAATSWVTDSAAGMSAIVTGQKTNNGVLSEARPPLAGQKEGEPLKTILEHAEEHGLSTGVLSNSPMSDATPAACYSHSSSRSKTGEIFAQILSPRFGDGVDVVIGPGRKAILDATAKLGLNLEPALREKGFAVSDSLEAVPGDARRVVALFHSAEFDFPAAVERAIGILSQNPKGFFLMVESDLHTDNIERGLKRAVAFDTVIRHTAERMKDDTLVIFAADHSFDFRLRSGRKGEPLVLKQSEGGAKANVRMDDGHTGEEVLVAATGPFSELVHGFFANTDLFRIMMAAFGWESSPAPR